MSEPSHKAPQYKDIKQVSSTFVQSSQCESSAKCSSQLHCAFRVQSDVVGLETASIRCFFRAIRFAGHVNIYLT